MTNSIPYLDTVIQWSNSLVGLPAGALVFILCISAGYIWKSIRVFPNRLIPLVVMVTGGLTMLLLTWAANEPVPLRSRYVIIGIIIGFVAWMVHLLVIKRIVKRFGLSDPGETGDAEITTKPDMKEKDQ